ncbi:hypothetical protein ABKN59_011674 [Abortiporus biennis]
MASCFYIGIHFLRLQERISHCPQNDYRYGRKRGYETRISSPILNMLRGDVYYQTTEVAAGCKACVTVTVFQDFDQLDSLTLFSCALRSGSRFRVYLQLLEAVNVARHRDTAFHLSVKK